MRPLPSTTSSPAPRIGEARTIQDLQGTGPASPFVGQSMAAPVGGVVTDHVSVPLRNGEQTRYVRGFTVQMSDRDARETDASRAIVVIPPRGRGRPALGAKVEFQGEIREISELSDSPFEATTTVVFADSVQTRAPGTESRNAALSLMREHGVTPHRWNVEQFEAWVEARLAQKGIEATPENFRREQAQALRSLESNLFEFAEGSRLASPSNPFGDHVVIAPDYRGPKTRHGAPKLDAQNHARALFNLGFSVGHAGRSAALRSGGVGNEAFASGSALSAGVWGALRYRSGQPQVDASIRHAPLTESAAVSLEPVRLGANPETDVVLLSLNTFNFDPHVENPNRVEDPRSDVSDDIGEERHLALADAILRCDSLPSAI
ncbi:MAG: hypothetical protein AAFQ82_22500, partial [Myxococcota bacterium]